jgi:hypothetical protein
MDPRDHNAEFTAALNRREELDEELVPFLSEDPKLGIMLRHPLIYNLFHTPKQNALVNWQLKKKKEYLAMLEIEGNWRGYVFMFVRPYRMNIFESIAHRLSDDEYWSILGSILVDTENFWQFSSLATRLISSSRPGRENLMEEEERIALAGLPDILTLYRGCSSHNRRGWSWTLDKEIAIWFSRRQRMRGEDIVLTGTAHKKDVVAYFKGRGEEEILIDPRKVILCE